MSACTFIWSMVFYLHTFQNSDVGAYLIHKRQSLFSPCDLNSSQILKRKTNVADICWFFSPIWIPRGRLAPGKTQNKVILFKNILKKEHMQSLSTVAVFDIWGQRRRIHTKLNENDMQRTLNFNKMHFEAWSFSPTISLFSTAGTLVVVTV